jgi:hypothetical protein
MTGFKLGRAVRLITAIGATGVALASIGAGTASAASTLDVCETVSLTCPYDTIQSAIADAKSNDIPGVDTSGVGDVISVGPGIYYGPLDVDVPVTIRGSGAGVTIIEPTTQPSPTTESFTPTGGSANYPLVYADGPSGGSSVAIADLTVDGLDDGASVGEPFEGIAGYDTTLAVNDVHVIGMSDGPPDSARTGYGIVDVNDSPNMNTVSVTNSEVEGYQQNGITVDGNANTSVGIAGNTVVGAGPTDNDGAGIAIRDLYWESTSSQGPTGSVTDNDVGGNICAIGDDTCGSDLLSDDYPNGEDDIGAGQMYGDSAGILLDNVSGSTASSTFTVSGNDVSDNDIGVWATTAPGYTTTIADNTLTDNLYTDVLAGFGATTVTSNTIGGGPDSSSRLDGVLVASYHADPADDAASATITANTITGTNAGVEVAQGDTSGAPTPSAIITNNAISGNTQGIENNVDTPVDAVDNWFGCNAGPDTPNSIGCDTVTSASTTTPAADAMAVTYSPFLVLTLTALPSTIAPGASATMLASIRQNSAGSSFPSGAFPSDLPVTFSMTSGSLDGSQTLVNGTATTTLSDTPLGAANVKATLDNQSASTNVTTANQVSTTSSVAPSTSASTITVTVPATVSPLIAFLSSSKLSLLADNPGSELTLSCVDGCSASVAGKITLSEKHHKHATLTLSTAQLSVAADSSDVYTVTLTGSQRNSVKRALSATLTLSVSAKDDSTGKTITGSRSFALTRG